MNFRTYFFNSNLNYALRINPLRTAKATLVAFRRIRPYLVDRLQKVAYFLIRKKQMSFCSKNVCGMLTSHGGPHYVIVRREKISNSNVSFFQESARKSECFDALFDSLAQSVGELWPKIASKTTRVAFAVLCSDALRYFFVIDFVYNLKLLTSLTRI